VQHDRTQRATGAPIESAIADRLTEIVHPATLTQISVYHALGLRARSLTLPVIVALVLSLIGRPMGRVCALARVVNREAVLWAPRQTIMQQAITMRLRVMPAQLFWNVLEQIVPVLRARWERRQRPLSDVMAWARAHDRRVLICDGSTLDALIRNVGLLNALDRHPLAGRISALLDGLARLPVWIGSTADAEAHDQQFWDDILGWVSAGMRRIFDRGYANFARFAQMTGAGITFVTRAKDNLAYDAAKVILCSAAGHDRVVGIGAAQAGTRQQVRLVEGLYRGKWHRSLRNERDAQRLPAEVLAGLYRQRWRIADAFGTVKSLLGLSYFFCGADNAVQVQVSAAWILYAVLADVTDAGAEALARPFADVSMEMGYRALYPYVRAAHPRSGWGSASTSLYPYVRAAQQNEAHDLIAFLVAEHKLLGFVKRKKPVKPKSRPHPLTDDEDA
jgi:hypothetical protein